MKVKLTHSSFLKGAEGGPGDIVDAPEAQAKAWLENGGAVEVTAEPKPAPRPKKADGMSKADTKAKGKSDE